MSLSPAETKADLTRSTASSKGSELIQFCTSGSSVYRSLASRKLCNDALSYVQHPREQQPCEHPVKMSRVSNLANVELLREDLDVPLVEAQGDLRL